MQAEYYLVKHTQFPFFTSYLTTSSWNSLIYLQHIGQKIRNPLRSLKVGKKNQNTFNVNTVFNLVSLYTFHPSPVLETIQKGIQCTTLTILPIPFQKTTNASNKGDSSLICTEQSVLYQVGLSRRLIHMEKSPSPSTAQNKQYKWKRS